MKIKYQPFFTNQKRRNISVKAYGRAILGSRIFQFVKCKLCQVNAFSQCKVQLDVYANS